ncbi:MAG: hypothetical protein HZB55_23755 [Deltaproteobacteria bacterium]|nr:hypothetical protein [Deltaproteobacteria bacterium]
MKNTKKDASWLKELTREDLAREANAATAELGEIYEREAELTALVREIALQLP